MSLTSGNLLKDEEIEEILTVFFEYNFGNPNLNRQCRIVINGLSTKEQLTYLRKMLKVAIKLGESRARRNSNLSRLVETVKKKTTAHVKREMSKNIDNRINNTSTIWE